MRLIKLAITLVVLAGFGYFAAKVPLGDKTLWQHTKAIASSSEAQKLVDGVKSAVGSGSSKSGATAGSGGVKKIATKPGANDEGKVSDRDRGRLRKVIRDELDAREKRRAR